MKLTIDRKQLASGVKTVGRAAAGRTTLPILNNLLLVARDGALKISATDLEVGITRWLEADISEEGETTVPAKTFIDLVSVAGNGDEVKINLLKGFTLKLDFGNVLSKVKGLDPQEFPPMFDGDLGDGIEFEADELRYMIARTAFAASDDVARPTLTGVKFAFASGELKLAAADGFRLSVLTLPAPIGNGKDAEVIIPATALKQLVGILDGRDDKVTMYLLDGKAVFRANGVELIATAINGNFPDVHAIIPSIHKTQAVFSASKMLKSCKAAHVFAREAANAVKLDLSPEGGKLQISATAAETGSNETVIELEKITGDPVVVGFNVKMLMDFLNTKAGEMVIFEIEDKEHPGVFKFQGNDEFIHIIMPMLHIGG